MKRALITGINGQDGSYLAEFLLEHGYEVYGTVREESIDDPSNMPNIREIKEKIHLVPLSLRSFSNIAAIFHNIRPDECYHLAASTFVDDPLGSDFRIMQDNLAATHHLILAILKCCPSCKLYFAGSSEMFGAPDHVPQDEDTTFWPRSVYGISKMSCGHLIRYYREKYDLFACTGILYNHESPRRGKRFVSRKITAGVAAICHGRQMHIEMGSLSARRDWGYAPDYVRAAHLMLQASEPQDYVVATGVLHTVQEMVDYAFAHVGLKAADYIRVNPDFVRPDEKIPLQGDFSKIYSELGWMPQKSFQQMVEEMVENDLRLLE